MRTELDFEFDFDLLRVGFVVVEDGLVDIRGLGREVSERTPQRKAVISFLLDVLI